MLTRLIISDPPRHAADGLSIPFFTMSRTVSRTVSLSAAATATSVRNRTEPEWLLNINWFAASGRSGPARYNGATDRTPAELDVENNVLVNEIVSVEGQAEATAKTVVGHSGNHNGSDHDTKQSTVPAEEKVAILEVPVVEEKLNVSSNLDGRRTPSDVQNPESAAGSNLEKEKDSGSGGESRSSSVVLALPEVVQTLPRGVHFPETKAE
jgi:hypothetical protein